MSKTIRNSRRLLAIVLVIALALFAFSLPAYAAEGDLDSETEASVSFTAGELKLVSVPALDFGDHPIEATAKDYPAVTAAPNVRVSDLRGSGAGWSLVASLSEFHLVEGGGATLQAASITTTPKVVAANGTVGTPPVAQNTIVLPSDGTETPIFSAGSHAGMGVWDLEWDATKTLLNVKPGTAQKGQSVATLTWSLQSTP